MLELIIFFGLGYATASLLRFDRPSFDNPDKVLKWDPSVFAWRPVPNGTTIRKDETVLFAFEMTKLNNEPIDEEG